MVNVLNKLLAEISVNAARHGKDTSVIDKYLYQSCPSTHFSDITAAKPEQTEKTENITEDTKASVIFPEANEDAEDKERKEEVAKFSKDLDNVLNYFQKTINEMNADIKKYEKMAAESDVKENQPVEVIVDDNDDDEAPTEMEKLLKPTPNYRNPKGKKARKAAKAAKEAAKKKVS